MYGTLELLIISPSLASRPFQASRRFK